MQLTTEEPWVFCWCMMLLTSHLSTVTSLLVLFSTFGLHIAIANIWYVYSIRSLVALSANLVRYLVFTIICMYCCHLLLWSSAICFCIFSFIVSDCCGSSFLFSKLLKLILYLFQFFMELFSLFVQTLRTGFATLNNMHLTMLTRYWWEIRLTWMKVKG